jgi:hypothetical protein
MKPITKNYWTFEKCREVAAKCRTTEEFEKKYKRVFKYALLNGWISKLYKYIKNPNRIWFYDNCKEEALKYKSRREFSKKASGAYKVACKEGWLDDICKHMPRLGNRCNKCIYVYLFSDNCAYVGLTYNMDERQKQRDVDLTDPVTVHIAKTGLIPTKTQLTDYDDVEIISKLEDVYIEKYKADGWKMLNTRKGGAIGGAPKWTFNKCKKEASKYNSRVEFQKNSNGAYSRAQLEGWLDEICKHMVRPVVHNKKWTFEICQEEALKYKTKIEFDTQNHLCYKAAYKMGWLDIICKHMIDQVKLENTKFWDIKENCIEKALLCKNRKQFSKLYRDAYNSSVRNGWLDDICTHMVKKIQKPQKPPKYWTHERCIEVMKICKTKKELYTTYNGAYKVCLREGWLKDYFPV